VQYGKHDRVSSKQLG